MLTLALANIRTYARRFIAVTLAVMIGTAFLSATLMVNSSATASLQRSIGEAYEHADLVAGIDDDAAATASADSSDAAEQILGAEQLAAVREVPGVGAAEPQTTSGARIAADSGDYNAVVQPFAADAQLRATELVSGRAPSGTGQITVDQKHAEQYGLSAGNTVDLTGTTPNGDPIDYPATITGITASSNSPFLGSNLQVAVSPERYATFTGDEPMYQSIMVRLDDGTDPAAATTAIADALRAHGISTPSVMTGQERTVEELASFTGGQDQFTVILLVFALIALVVTGLVVMNTFAVLVAQRTRELALLRTLGAMRAQLRRSVLIEALVIGVVSSALGVALAIGVMAALVGYVSTLPEASFAVLSVSPVSVIAGLAVGTIMTLLAAWAPARRAMSVAPLAALRPADDANVHNRIGKVRLVFGLVLAAGGGALLAVGAVAHQLLVGFAGGLLSFIGILMLASLFLPGAVRAVGRAVGGSGVPAKLASLNAVRNPGRTTATATALLIGVTLVSMMMVGAQTTKQSFGAELGRNYLVDFVVDSPAAYGEDFGGAALPGAGQDASGPEATPEEATPSTRGRVGEAQAKAASAIDGVSAVALLEPVARDADGNTLYAADAGVLAAVLNDPDLVPANGEVLAGQNVEAKQLTVHALEGTETRTLEVKRSQSDFSLALMTTATAQQLPGYAPGGAVSSSTSADGEWTMAAYPALWIKADAGLDTAALQQVGRSLAADLDVSDYLVTGGAMEKALFTQVIDTLLLVVSGLLAVAVFIALIGVANTLSLSVLERTRESALLRALGLTRGQLRGMLALEAVLIAGVAALLGIVLGTTYGVLGAQSAIGSFAAVSLSLPWAQLALVLGIAALAALAASVLPARRAARLSPVEGLATE
ncbi:FtsX-like permease family protein [Arthrobacter sp. JSM 101049]|uniref:FtsX-like permease family protein n=1 Tax=Arthrobacter sp. JSM 101049 TaxID=929097 RepID=UPI003564882F